MKKELKGLKVWEKSLILVSSIYKFTREFPEEEKFGLTKQIRRCSVSVVSNIAEGNSRFSKKEKGRFLEVAYGSIVELQVQLVISMKLGFLSELHFQGLDKEIVEIRKMLSGLYKRHQKLKP